MKDIKENYPSWNELVKMKPATTIKDWFEDGIRCLIMRGPYALCAYVGVPSDHPIANKGYDDIPLDCHGGLTFSGEGDGDYRPKGFYWYGWDYGHAGDYSFYYDEQSYSTHIKTDEHKWTVEEVEQEIKFVLYDFKRLCKLMESKTENP